MYIVNIGASTAIPSDSPKIVQEGLHLIKHTASLLGLNLHERDHYTCLQTPGLTTFVVVKGA